MSLTGKTISQLTHLTSSLTGNEVFPIEYNGATYHVSQSQIVANAASASYASTASYVVNAQTASYVLNAVSASKATSASYASTALLAQQVSTSISSQNLQHNVLFVDTSGPGFIQVDGGLRYNPNQDLLTTTASFALTASYVTTAQTASYILNAVSASYASTASYVLNAVSASYATNALTASYLSGYISPFPYTGSAIISGSLAVTGSLKVTGSITSLGVNTFIGVGSTLGSNLATSAAGLFYQNGFSGVIGIGGFSNGAREIQSALNGGAS